MSSEEPAILRTCECAAFLTVRCQLGVPPNCYVESRLSESACARTGVSSRDRPSLISHPSGTSTTDLVGCGRRGCTALLFVSHFLVNMEFGVFFVAALGLVLGSCGGHMASDSDSGASGDTTTQAASTGAWTAGTRGDATRAAWSAGSYASGTLGVGVGGGMQGCFAGLQLDHCCSAPVAGDSLTGSDPCLVPYGEWFSPDALAACPAAEACLELNCVHPEPASRVVARRSSKCEFVDECASDGDCEVAVDHGRCCSCPEVMPRVVVAEDPCVVGHGQPAPSGCADCSAVDCGACTEELLVPACGHRGDPELGICQVAPR